MIATLDRIVRLGWIRDFSPIVRLESIEKFGAAAPVFCKRDDLIPVLDGGTKTRKLDYLLAQSPYREASGWHSVGAIGSGHLRTLLGAAKTLQRSFHAHCFYEEIDANILENIGRIVADATRVYFYRSRAHLFFQTPRVLLSKTMLDGLPCVPPGATAASSMIGLVRAGLELAEQIRAKELPEPRRIYVPLGTGGTAVGLSVGLALGGMKTEIRAVSAVERIFSAKFRLQLLRRKVMAGLRSHGVEMARHFEPTPIVIDRSQVGRGYGMSTPKALEACDIVAQDDLRLEGVYSGKAMAALIADCRSGQPGPMLFWNTVHRR